MVSLGLWVPQAARAEDPAGPAAPAKKKVEWKAAVQAGFLMNTGNANTLTFSAGGAASRNDGKNKLT